MIGIRTRHFPLYVLVRVTRRRTPSPRSSQHFQRKESSTEKHKIRVSDAENNLGRRTLCCLSIQISLFEFKNSKKNQKMFSKVCKTQMRDRTVGVVFRKDSKVCQGLTLVSCGRETYLLDIDGRVVNVWRSDRKVFSAYLCGDGTLIRDGNDRALTDRFGAGGGAGIVEAVTYENERIWSFKCRPSQQFLSHHDIEVMPNGNVLILVWERLDESTAIEAGRRPEMLPDKELWNNVLLELKPNGKGGADVVWSFSFLEHTVQDCDKTKMNYGDVSKTPHRVDINLCPVGGKAHQRGLNIFEGKEGKTGEKDWIHCNSVSYDRFHDRIALSMNVQSEIVIVDHSSAQRGIIWRFGNSQNYRQGDRFKQVLFNQHAAQFVNQGRSLLCFNNGRKPDRWWSSVDEIAIRRTISSTGDVIPLKNASSGTLVPLFDADLYDKCTKSNIHKNIPQRGRPVKTSYSRDWSSGAKDYYGEIVWSYGARRHQSGSFYITHMGSCQRLENGNTLIVTGPDGVIIEVTDEGEEVWRWVSPIVNITDGESGAVSFIRQGDQRPAQVNVSIFQAWRYGENHFTDSFLESHPDLSLALLGHGKGKLYYLEPYP